MKIENAQVNLIAAQQAYIAEMMKMLGSVTETVSYPVQTSSVPTFKEYTEDFMKSHKQTMKATSYANYQYYLVRHILDYFGDYRLDEISSKVIQEFVDKKKSDVSVKSLREFVSLIKNILHDAERAEIILPKKIDVKFPKPRKKEYRTLTDGEYKRLYDFLLEDGTTNDLGILIAMETGARIGEICGLKWSDIDFEKNKIQIKRTVSRYYDYETGTTTQCIGTPKTQKSERDIYITKRFADVLKQHRPESDCYICTERQKPTEPRTLRQCFDRKLKKAGIEKINFHGLRHTFATRAISTGVDPKTVAEILGHENCNITLDIYTSCTPEMLVTAMEKLEKR